MLRIGIIDDHRLFRKSLRLLVNAIEGSQVILEAGNYSVFFDQLNNVSIDLLLLHVKITEMEGIKTYLTFRNKFPYVKVLIISQLGEKESISKAMELGANGIISKNSDPESLNIAIQSIRNKGFYFQNELNAVIAEVQPWEDNKVRNEVPSVQLSVRELDVIRMACKEFNSIEIADKLCINVRTVENHRKRIMEKTNSKNFIGVILYALKYDYISIEDL